MSLTGSIKGESVQGSVNRLYELRGYSAYEVAVLCGFEGTKEEWLASLKGDKGDPGEVIHTDADGDVLEDVFAKKKPVYNAGTGNFAEVISKAEAGSIVQLAPGDYPLLTFTGEHGLARADTDNPLNGTVLTYPENLTIMGSEGVTVAGISITSGVESLDVYNNTDISVFTLPKGLTLIGLTLSDSVCLRNGRVDNLSVVGCHFTMGAVQISPNLFVDKHGTDIKLPAGRRDHYESASIKINNVLISGNTFDKACDLTTEEDTTTAISVFSAHNVIICRNTVKQAAFNGIALHSQSGQPCTGIIGISSNKIGNLNNTTQGTGDRAIRINALEGAAVYVLSNTFNNLNLQTPTNTDYILVTACKNTEFRWNTTGNDGANSYKNKGYLSAGKGITIKDCVDESAQLAEHIGNKENPHGATAKQVGARPDTWMPTAAEVGAAPAGYGLGGDAAEPRIKSIEELDNVTKNGWYRFECMGSQLCGFYFNFASVSVTNMSENAGVWQELRPLNTFVVLRRLKTSDGVWDNWEIDRGITIVAEGTSGDWTYTKWSNGTADLWKKVDLSEYGDSRCLYAYETLPFYVHEPVVNMTLQGAEIDDIAQGAIVLSYYAERSDYMKFSMIRDEGGLTDGDFVSVSVQIKCKWQ